MTSVGDATVRGDVRPYLHDDENSRRGAALDRLLDAAAVGAIDAADDRVHFER